MDVPLWRPSLGAWWCRLEYSMCHLSWLGIHSQLSSSLTQNKKEGRLSWWVTQNRGRSSGTELDFSS